MYCLKPVYRWFILIPKKINIYSLPTYDNLFTKITSSSSLEQGQKAGNHDRTGKSSSGESGHGTSAGGAGGSRA